MKVEQEEVGHKDEARYEEGGAKKGVCVCVCVCVCDVCVCVVVSDMEEWTEVCEGCGLCDVDLQRSKHLQSA